MVCAGVQKGRDCSDVWVLTFSSCSTGFTSFFFNCECWLVSGQFPLAVVTGMVGCWKVCLLYMLSVSLLAVYVKCKCACCFGLCLCSAWNWLCCRLNSSVGVFS